MLFVSLFEVLPESEFTFFSPKGLLCFVLVFFFFLQYFEKAAIA
jgi:hypothetical protein